MRAADRMSAVVPVIALLTLPRPVFTHLKSLPSGRPPPVILTTCFMSASTRPLKQDRPSLSTHDPGAMTVPRCAPPSPPPISHGSRRYRRFVAEWRMCRGNQERNCAPSNFAQALNNLSLRLLTIGSGVVVLPDTAPDPPLAAVVKTPRAHSADSPQPHANSFNPEHRGDLFD